jgi:NADH:ubiquinone oxidoreductase subunit E
MERTVMATATENWAEVEAKAKACLPPAVVDFIEQCRKSPECESHLIAVLHRVQGHFGHLGREQLDAVAQLMQIPAAKVAGVATFYHFFRLEKRGRFTINVCLGTACYVKGADKVVAKFQEELGVDFGETSKDGLFTLEISRCLGTCGLAPVVMIDNDVHPKVKPDHVPALLEKYRQKAEDAPGAGAAAGA